MVCHALGNVCDSDWVYVIDLLYLCYDGHNALMFENFLYCHLHQLKVFFVMLNWLLMFFILLPAVWICLAPFEWWAFSSFIGTCVAVTDGYAAVSIIQYYIYFST
jgi:hypothetical protein